MATRVKQLCMPAGERVNAGEVRALVTIAPKTGQSQVAGNRVATMSTGNDVVDLERQVVIPLSDATVFTSVVRPLPHKSFERPFHVSRFVQETRRRVLSNWRARDFRIDSIVPTRQKLSSSVSSSGVSVAD